MLQPHFLLVTFPAQGHINPALQFAKRLTHTGARVTFTTCVSAYRRMITKGPLPDGLIFASFSDGYDDGFKSSSDDPQRYMSEIKRRGTETLMELIEANRNGGHPFTCMVYTLLLPWAAKVARESHLPSALLWVQPASVFDIYYYYFNGYDEIISKAAADNHSSLINLPGLPPLYTRDLPSFIVPSSTYTFALPAFQEQMEVLKEETNPKILINTFDVLEPEALNAVPNLKMVGVGPLIASRILEAKDDDQMSASFGADLFQDSKNYTQWLDSKPESSVVYVSFGTIAVLTKQQLAELARALIERGRPFLWVITDKSNRSDEKEIDMLESFRQELEEIGLIVSWCSQVEVLKHKSVGCFVTHCGWNSTLESLVFGVPVVAFPQWTDQMTNAKLLEDSWKTGVRVRENEEGVVESGEIRRCLEVVMEEKVEELRRNAEKWRDFAAEAAKEGGSSDKNLRAFVDELVGETCT